MNVIVAMCTHLFLAAIPFPWVPPDHQQWVNSWWFSKLDIFWTSQI